MRATLSTACLGDSAIPNAGLRGRDCEAHAPEPHFPLCIGIGNGGREGQNRAWFGAESAPF